MCYRYMCGAKPLVLPVCCCLSKQSETRSTHSLLFSILFHLHITHSRCTLYTLHIVHFILHISSYVVHYTHFTLYTTHFILYTTHILYCTLHTSYTLYITQHTSLIIHHTQHSIQQHQHHPPATPTINHPAFQKKPPIRTSKLIFSAYSNRDDYSLLLSDKDVGKEKSS